MTVNSGLMGSNPILSAKKKTKFKKVETSPQSKHGVVLSPIMGKLLAIVLFLFFQSLLIATFPLKQPQEYFAFSIFNLIVSALYFTAFFVGGFFLITTFGKRIAFWMLFGYVIIFSVMTTQAYFAENLRIAEQNECSQRLDIVDQYQRKNPEAVIMSSACVQGGFMDLNNPPLKVYKGSYLLINEAGWFGEFEVNGYYEKASDRNCQDWPNCVNEYAYFNVLESDQDLKEFFQYFEGSEYFGNNKIGLGCIDTNIRNLSYEDSQIIANSTKENPVKVMFLVQGLQKSNAFGYHPCTSMLSISMDSGKTWH